MLRRCEDPKKQAYMNYGGRGITVSEAWHDFAIFYADMGPRPTPQHTLERRDNSQGYEKTNCFWATRTEQNRNRRSNVFVTHNGITKCASEWAADLGMKSATLRKRLADGKSVVDALTIPVLQRPGVLCVETPLTYQNVTQSAKEWALHLGVKSNSLLKRLRDGWSVEETLSIPFGSVPGGR